MLYVMLSWLILLFLNVKHCRAAPWNLTIDIMHRQVLDDHLIFFAFKNPSSTKPLNETYTLEYKCMTSYPVPFCQKSWVPLTACSVTDSASCVFYSCSLRADEVLLFNRYMLRGTAWSPAGLQNATLSFTVRIPVYPKLENLTANAMDYNTVRLSWNKVALLSDLKKYKTDNVNMQMRISIIHNNITDSLDRILKPWATSTTLHGFKANHNYSFLASYHFIIPGLQLPSSTVSGPVSVQTPHKPVISSPALNQSCVVFSNRTGKYFNISWKAPSSVVASQQSTVSLELKTGTKVKIVELKQMPSTSQSITVAAAAGLVVSIKLCSKAGCSSRVFAICKLHGKRSGNEYKSDFLPYGVIALVSICIFLTILGISALCWKKRRKLKPKKNTEISPVGPRPANPYDDPVSHVGPYEIPCTQITDAEPTHAEIENNQNERFIEENDARVEVSDMSYAVDNVSFSTKL